MGDTRTEYVVIIGGVEHTLLLSGEDAARYGDAATPAVKVAKAPANKAAPTPTNK